MSEAIDAFDRVAGGYDEWYATEKGRQVFAAERGLLERMLPSDGVGLEIGAGTGAFADALSDPRRVICLDLSREMLARAAAKGLPCVLVSADRMPLRDGTLDFAYMVTVMEFLEEPVTTLAEASRVTTRNAPIVALTINAESSWGRLYASMAERDDPIFSHAHLYAPTEVEGIGRDAGLRRLEALGTLTTDPTSPEAGGEIQEPGAETGVVATRFARR